MWTIFAWFCTAVVALVALKYFSIPYMWIFLATAVALFVTAATDRRRRPLWFNVACIAIALALSEYYLWANSIRGLAANRTVEGNVIERVHAPDDTLGWAPLPSTVARDRILVNGELVYDTTYTIGRNGLRISSPTTNGREVPAECLLFFGGSFMFGQGLTDRQTVPYLVYEKSSGRYRTYNFGVKGYGAHQMLSALQHGLVRDVVHCDPAKVSHIFYQGITDHIRRSAGRLWWNTRGPRYVLGADGRVRLDGRFEDDGQYKEDTSLLDLLGTQMFKSMIYRQVVQGQFLYAFSERDRSLYLGIVDEARRMARAEFPAATFHVLWWDEDSLDNQAVIQGLRQRGITVHLMSEILPNYRSDGVNLAYQLHETDPHPNALANELIAQFVMETVQRSRRPEPEVDGGMSATSGGYLPAASTTSSCRPGSCRARSRRPRLEHRYGRACPGGLDAWWARGS